jgi:Holliday junction resolvase-like predicted endonuclease
MTVSSERQAAERAVAEYERQGYTVERDVNLSKIDPRLPNIEVDLVARRGSELVFVEVKNRASVRASSLEQLQAASEQLPDARVDLVLTGQSEVNPDSALIKDYLERAEEIFERDRRASLLLAWTALEGAVRRILIEQDLAGDPAFFTCRQGLSDLYGNRIISWSAYSKLMALSRTRDKVAHSQDATIDRSEFEILRSYGRYLASPEFTDYEDALEIAREALRRADLGNVPVPQEWQKIWIAGALPTLTPREDLDEILQEISTR